MNPKIKDFLCFLILAFLGFIVYSNSFKVPFLYDDRALIPYSKWNIIPFYFYFSKNDFGNFLKSIFQTNRPILTLSFFLNYKLGDLNPFSYHIVNLTFHILTAFLIYLTLKNIIENPLLPVLSASIFLVHPITVESVTYISSRSSILSAFFYIVPFYLLSKKKLKNSNSIIYYILSIFSYLFSIGCKEIGITLPLMLLIYDYFFLSGENKKELMKRAKGCYIPMGILTLVMIFLRFNFALSLQSPDQAVRGLYQHILTEIHIFAFYLIKFFLPINLNVDPDFHLANSLLQFNFLLSAILLASLILIAWYFRKKSKILSFAIAWLLITVSPHFLIRLRDLMADRWLYLSLISLSFLSGTVFLKTLSFFKEGVFKKTSIKVIYTGLILFITFLSILTFNRNFVWKSEIALWSDAVKKSPDKERPHGNLGKAYTDKGMIDEALAEFEKAIEIDPSSGQAHYNLGNCYYGMGKVDDAITQYGLAIKAKRDYVLAYNNLGIAYFSKGLYEEGVKACKKAIEINPFLYQPYYNLGNYYQKMGKIDDAITQYKIALEINPGYSVAYNNLGTVYFAKGLYGDAINAYMKAIEISPNFAEAYNNLGNVYGKMNIPEEAIQAYRKALSIDFNLFESHYMLASSYMQIGAYENAFKEFGICLRFRIDIRTSEDIREKMKSLQEKLKMK